MELTVDSTTTKLNDASSVTTLAMSHTSSGADRALTVSVPRSRGVTCSVTCDGVPMTSGVAIANGSARAEIFGIIGQAAGVNSIVVTYSAANGFYTAQAISYNGANQSDLFGASGTQTGTGTSKSLSITTEEDGSLLVDCIGSIGTVHTPGAGQTEVASAANRVSSYKAAPAAGTNGTSWTGTTSSAYAYAIVEIKVAPVVEVSPDSTSHGHTADSPTVTQTHAVAPDDASHGHTADSPTVTQDHQVAPDNASHGHTAGTPTVTQTHAVAPDDASHGHTADSPTVTQTHAVAPASATHGHTAGSPTVLIAPVRPADCRHGHRATMPLITQSHTVGPDDCRHAHSAASPTVQDGTFLLPAPVAGFTLPRQRREFRLPRQDREFTLPRQRREFRLERAT